ncbi:MAG: hypothetical protein DMF88_14305 [Acidobacteria bacterium]|nr:MAG: hypothetical protein DMF88_14305 [Acidobacteriota bacterium]
MDSADRSTTRVVHVIARRRKSMANRSKPTTRRELETAIVVKAIKDGEFRQRLLSNPREGVVAAVKEIDPDFEIPQGIDVKVFEETKKAFYLVLPQTPTDNIEISDEDLEKVAGGIFTDQWGDATVIIGY